MDFYQTCPSILLRHGKELIIFPWPWPHFQGHRRAQIVGKWLVCILSHEGMEGFWLNLYIYIVVTLKKNWLDFDDHDPFSRSHKGLICWKMACLHPISWRNRRISTKLVHLYCCDIEKNWLDFDDLDPFSRSHKSLDCWKMACLHPIMMEWIDFDQTCTTILLWHKKELIRFWWPWPHFQGDRRAQVFGKWLFCTLSPERMDFEQTCTAILLRQEQELIRFRWPWPH